MSVEMGNTFDGYLRYALAASVEEDFVGGVPFPLPCDITHIAIQVPTPAAMIAVHITADDEPLGHPTIVDPSHFILNSTKGYAAISSSGISYGGRLVIPIQVDNLLNVRAIPTANSTILINFSGVWRPNRIPLEEFIAAIGDIRNVSLQRSAGSEYSVAGRERRL